MKASDFRPQHFENGRSFDRKVFREYVKASETMSKTLYTRYLPCAAAGILLGFLFSKGVGGFIGNILALVCIFGGLIAGAVFNISAAKEVNGLAARLGITKEDVSRAREHVKNGSVAWGGEEEDDEESFAETSEEAAAEVLPARPVRALIAAGLIYVTWILLALSYTVSSRTLTFNPDSLICLSGGLLGAAVCLIIQKGVRWKVAGAGVGVAALFRYASSVYFLRNTFKLVKLRDGLMTFFPFRQAYYHDLIRSFFFRFALALVVALLLSLLLKKLRFAKALICGSAAALVSIFNDQTVYTFFTTPSSQVKLELVSQVLPTALNAAAATLLSCLTLYALCNMQRPKIKMKWPGIVWCCLGLAGSAAVIVMAVWRCVAGRDAFRSVMLNTHSVVLGLFILIGYILLLCGRHEGVYFVILAAGLSLIPQFISALRTLIFAKKLRDEGWALMLTTVLGALNPLLAWLSAKYSKTSALHRDGTQETAGGSAENS